MIAAWEPARERSPERLILARRADGRLQPAGSVSLGLTPETRARLRDAPRAVELPRRGPKRRVRAVEPTIAATVEFHRITGGTIRDGVLRRVSIPA